MTRTELSIYYFSLDLILDHGLLQLPYLFKLQCSTSSTPGIISTFHPIVIDIAFVYLLTLALCLTLLPAMFVPNSRATQ